MFYEKLQEVLNQINRIGRDLNARIKKRIFKDVVGLTSFIYTWKEKIQFETFGGTYTNTDIFSHRSAAQLKWDKSKVSMKV